MGPPFNHPAPTPGERYNGDLCEYPDILKELAFIIYHEATLRAAVFAALGVSTPLTMQSYKFFLRKLRPGGILGLYDVLFTCLHLRDQGMLNNI